MLRPTIDARLVACLALLLHSAPAQAAGDALPVHVSFELGTKLVANLFPNDVRRAEVERDLARGIAERCQARFRYWLFQPASEPSLPRLHFRLRTTGGELALTAALLNEAGTQKLADWSVPMFKPGDLEAFTLPSAERWPERILATVDAMLAGKEGGEIRAALQARAPLGASCAPVVASPQSADEAVAVLPLSIDRYKTLATSTFAIHVMWVGRGHAVIHSVGTGSALAYPGAEFRGIAVRHHEFEDPEGGRARAADRLAEIGAVQLGLVFLEREDSLGGVLLADGH